MYKSVHWSNLDIDKAVQECTTTFLFTYKLKHGNKGFEELKDQLGLLSADNRWFLSSTLF